MSTNPSFEWGDHKVVNHTKGAATERPQIHYAKKWQQTGHLLVGVDW